MLQRIPTMSYLSPRLFLSNPSVFNLDTLRTDKNQMNERSLFKIAEENEKITYSLIAPGVTKDEFQISIKKDVLKVDWREEGYNHSQSVMLQNNLDFDQTIAKLENGILSVMIPKEKPEIDKIIKIQ
jgi:HSP20 family molecular chaperone IbpA